MKIRYFYAGVAGALFLSLGMILRASLENHKAPTPPPVCVTNDDSVTKVLEFSRCETSEVVCYVSKGGQTCYAKPASAVSPTPEVKSDPKKTK